MSVFSSSSGRISTGQDSMNKECFINVRQMPITAFQMDLYGRFLVCKREGETVLSIIGVPSERWDEDVKDSGFQILDVIESPTKTLVHQTTTS